VFLEGLGWIEIVGIADRTSYDLTAHQKRSEVDMSVFIPFEKPLKVKKTIVTPDMKTIGPKFKGKAGKIMAALKAMKPEELEKPEVRLTIDGEEVVIESSLFRHETVEVDVNGENIIPHVVEPSYGVDRILYSVLEHAYDEEIVEDEERIVLRLDRKVAPITMAVLPLLSREPLTGRAAEITKDLKSAGFYAEYDDSGTIGKRYRRNDEAGTPFCVTVDFETIEDGTVTVRDRDSMAQVRIQAADLPGLFSELLCTGRPLEGYGKKV
jgi:glycyl-tRNA synthetase